VSASHTSPHPRWVKPTQLDHHGNLTPDSVAGSKLLFDWERLGIFNTALRFVINNTGGGVLTVTPEAAYTDAGPPEVGTQAPAAFTVGPGEAYGDPYGMDEMRPYWRLWVSGNSTFEWGVLGVSR